MSRRFELTFPDELWRRMELARQHEPAASYIKRAVEAALGHDGAARGSGRAITVEASPAQAPPPKRGRGAESQTAASASPRASADEGTPIPKIAKWKR